MKNPYFKQIGNTIKKPIVTTFDSTIKNSVIMFHRNKNIIKNIGSRLQKKFSMKRHYFGSKTVKLLGEKGIQNFKNIAPPC